MELASIEAMQAQKTMTTEQKLVFQSQYNNERKDPTTTTILAIFGLHYFYLGKIGLGILFLVTWGGCWIWWLIDLFRAGGYADSHNRLKVTEIAAFVNACHE